MTGRVVYSMSVSLDGYINSPSGSLDWVDIDEEVHGWFNDRARAAGAFIYGRRLYETMTDYWPTAEANPNATPVEVDFARIWGPKPKVVFSSTLESVDWNSRLLRTNIIEELAALKAEFEGDLDVGGATLASALVERNLIDEYRLVVHPVILGGGTPFFPAGTPLDLRLIDSHRFDKGAVLLAYVPR
ncbi:MAG TPA: dihydrofolate reductase family protein [Candidatus Limnocylindrales bacterium]